MIETPLVGMEARSYDERQTPDRHGYTQLVLPLTGLVQLDIAGKQGKLDPLHGAIVEAGAWHSQRSTVANRSLILDVDQRVLTGGRWSVLLDRPFTAINPAARKLVEFMHLCLDAGTAQPELIRGWMPLLFDALAMRFPQANSRLSALLAQIEARPALPWSTESMARFASMSVSRLHALFQEELDISPHAWLLRKRIDLACELLTHTNRPIVDVALSTGFSDQSVLTRAMRQNIDMTPAAYRRQGQEKRPKQQ
jgi:transcriptional regulator GlxA family with amidase domain